jgi:type IV secretion system protein VirB10
MSGHEVVAEPWGGPDEGGASEPMRGAAAAEAADAGGYTAGSSDTVLGERDNSVTRTLSLQSRMSNLLAIGLMTLLGLGSLTWYYANAMMRQGHAGQVAKAAAANRAQGDVPLPSLGHIAAPMAAPAVDPFIPVRDPPADPQPNLPGAASTLAELPLAPSQPVMATGVPPPKTPAELAVERQLSGAVFAGPSAGASATGVGVGGATFSPARNFPAPNFATNGLGGPAMGVGAGAGGVADGLRQRGELSTWLQPTATAAARAEVLPARRLLLPKGSFIDCTLETAIDSTLPGMTTCVMATDAFGADGNVVLLERGTKLIGETRGEVQQGAARIFVLWTEARTPTGVVVPLDSPGADELGRAGLPGEVNRHFWERFGAAMLVSVVNGAVQAAAQSSHGGSGNVIVNPSASQDVLTEILKNTIGIPPTVTKQNGDRIQVFVARDVDFRSVYELQSVAR